ncbi:MAG TPA: major capsid protein [Sporichthya sp.]|jgi:hypothetical protein|nr:major capsid protein [Sporichthya sp.]
MLPTLPENFGTLNSTELKALRDALKAALKDIADGETSVSNEDLTKAVEDLATVRSRIPVVLAAEVALAEADPEDDEDEDDDEDGVPDLEPVPDPASSSTPTPAPEPEVVVPEVIEPAAAAVPAVTFKPTGRTTAKPDTEKTFEVARLQAMENVPGKRPGEAFSGWTELAELMYERSRSLSPSSNDRIAVAKVLGGYDKEPGRVLDERVEFNLSRFEPDELTAALCAPFTPYYGMSCANTARRPVFASLPQFQAPRGGVSIYPSPTLADITDGTGVWTADDDANPTAVKADCQTIECATPVDYVMYAVYRCLTVKNMLQMTFPELLEAYLNRLAAAWARMAEKRLLDLMGANVSQITAPTQKVGASESILTTMLQFVTAYQERQRWDFDTVEIWAPRWLQNALKVDMFHQRRTDGAKTMPTDGDVTAVFARAGATVHWYLDDPTWKTDAAPSQPVADGNLVGWPDHVNLLVAPPGKFALIDRGELRVGVTGNNIYRDLTSLMRNEFTFFFESFEGIVDTNSCPADLVDIPVCFNGVQVADVTVDCDLV